MWDLSSRLRILPNLPVLEAQGLPLLAGGPNCWRVFNRVCSGLIYITLSVLCVSERYIIWFGLTENLQCADQAWY